MNPTDFAKIAFAGTTSSAAGAGAAAGYGYFIPKTFRELMSREGGIALTSDTDFQSILFDQKAKVEAFVKDSVHDQSKQIKASDDRVAEIRSWCQTKAIQDLDTVPDKVKYKDYYINLCTTKGITTVKGFLTKWRSNANWAEERPTSDQAVSYKGIFAVYRNSEDFLKWINQKKDSTKHKDQIVSSTTNDKGYPVLKEVCEQGLKMSWASRTNEEMAPYSFFCTVAKDDTVKGRLSLEQGWKERTTWTGVKDKWYQTSGVQPAIKRTNGTDPVNNDDYKKWCGEILKARLGAKEDTYPNDYKFARQICKEDTTQTTP